MRIEIISKKIRAFSKTQFSQLYVHLFWLNAWKLSAPNIFVCVAEYLGMTAGMIVFSYFAMRFLK
ncbi:hypothetical protein [uncultured Treponema sp.]|uniref:hypothetical protein n=1 Tax=uncultured Treponema sp. TaxID=162155 RepID=UPI00280BC2FB|nr:hypothetical protein [uncultured Treponema sp.]